MFVQPCYSQPYAQPLSNVKSMSNYFLASRVFGVSLGKPRVVLLDWIVYISICYSRSANYSERILLLMITLYTCVAILIAMHDSRVSNYIVCMCALLVRSTKLMSILHTCVIAIKLRKHVRIAIL